MKAAIDALDLTDDLAKKFIPNKLDATGNDLKLFLKQNFNEIFLLK
ncbi:hypothetical protein SAMN04515674_101122 [Pseudarcicella hirudinis]|uniref:Uncharacterized protein n=1 Tax=Pseudarcicella hirudinis TaxID=1079859 RepID=A0A1I5M5Q2_9BACT|nr:hypothetical protein [Pseudarcicella hirudinis]SFP04351.1 hypothetical protein SAMN04515674_101122 [Pseudarcicella hirudinis]